MAKEYTRIYDIQGSIPHYGNVLYNNDFSKSWNIDTTPSNDDKLLYLAASAAYSGNAGLVLAPDHISPAANDYNLVNFTFSPSSSKTFFLYTYFRLPTLLSCKKLEFIFTLDNTINEYSAKILYDPINNKFQYLNSANTYTDIPDSSYTLEDNRWYRLIWGINIDTTKHIFLMLAHLKFDLSSYLFVTGATNDVFTSYLQVKITTQSTTAPIVHLDNILITSDYH